MKHVRILFLALVLLAASVSTGLAYTKPTTYRSFQLDCPIPGVPVDCTISVPGRIIFETQIPGSPHTWVISKALDLIQKDGYASEANLARKYLLPMYEGVTFNDVWGDADIAGASVLDYYIPDSPETNFGYGCALDGFAYAPYKNCTNSVNLGGGIVSYLGFDQHPFYGYGNAAEHAQFRYDYAERIYLGHWGDDDRDRMGGWVIDDLGVIGPGQDDPFNGRWASGASGIHDATAPDGTQSRFGVLPAEALSDLFLNHTHVDVMFPAQTDEALSTFHVPSDDVMRREGDWLDARFGDADTVEAYVGWDGVDSAVYANWTMDTSGHCGGQTDCAAPMVVRVPVNSKAHAFFNLGWAIHLLEDNTTPVHTINGSVETYHIHNDIETLADYAIQSASVDAGYVHNLIPADTTADFVKIYDWPPTPGTASCATKAPVNPSFNFQPRWYADTLPRMSGEGVAHAYTRDLADIAHRFMPYIECIDTEDDHNWPSMGFFTTLALDNAVKATAGLIRRFIEDVDKTAPTVAISQPMATTYPHSGTLKLQYSDPIDDESGVKSFTATLDSHTAINGHPVASGLILNLLTDLNVGDHTLALTATDNAGNVAAPSVTFSVIVTPASIMDDVTYFLSTHDITVNNEANSLMQKLRAGAAYRAAGDCRDANEVYQSFIGELVAQTGKKVSATAAAIMIADAQYLIAHCP
jgi:hypothetical protein